MSIWQTLLLGIVQGIAEFLPISSSGHLVIVESLLGSEVENLELNVALHFGTLLSILVVYRRDILPTLRKLRLVAAIIVATLPVVVVGLFFKDLLEQAFSTPLAAGAGLLVTATLLFITPRLDGGTRTLDELRLRDALVVGLFQAIAPIPGISRSGSTIFGGLLAGLRRDTATDFSFYIAVPAILGATVLAAKGLLEEGPGETPFTALLVGMVVSFVVGIVSLKALIRIVAGRRLHLFGWYCLIVGLLVLALGGMAARS